MIGVLGATYPGAYAAGAWALEPAPVPQSAYFKWGTAPDALIHTTVSVVIADGDAWVPIAELLSGLEPLTTY